jgi:DNA sulfur modification protein DndE
MSALIERVKISADGKHQLSTLKRRTGIEHYNIICRHALCASLANTSRVPPEALQYTGGLEIDWQTLGGEAAATLQNLLIVRALEEEGDASPIAVRKTLQAHLHRGLAYLISDPHSLASKGHVLT